VISCFFSAGLRSGVDGVFTMLALVGQSPSFNFSRDSESFDVGNRSTSAAEKDAR
jgi:hypothetical protein